MFISSPPPGPLRIASPWRYGEGTKKQDKNGNFSFLTLKQEESGNVG